MKNQEIMEEVANRVVKLMETHGTNWVKPWQGSSGFPHNIASGKNYRGINVILLMSAGFSTSVWGTYKQWSAKGAQVAKGSKGTRIVFWKPLDVDDKDKPGKKKQIWMLKTYVVFNADQVEGYDAPTLPTIAAPSEIACPEMDEYFAKAGVDLRHGGDKAFFSPMANFVQMPNKKDFNGTKTSTAREAYYSTLAHEVTHWTGHASRLDRIKASRFGSKDYAFEELVAELGAVFMSMQFGISPAPRPDHAQYLNNWIAAMKETPRVIFSACKDAQAAMDWLETETGTTIAA